MPDVTTFFQNVFPDVEYRQQLFSKIMTDIDSGKVENMNWDNILITQKSGEQRFVNAVTIPIIDQKTLVSTLIDITKLKNIELNLKETNELNNSLLQTLPFGMDIVDKNGNLLFISQNLRQKFKGEVIGKKCWELYSDKQEKCPDCPLCQ
ncbi:MAG: PAS domain-containing protein [Bacteroidetes bacterium]|nr:PAS domain-containing protein [Bacteroidota bacterium]